MSYPDSHQAVPLHYAAQMCALPGEDSDSRLGLLMLHKLLSKKVKVDCADEDKRTPLLWAASSGRAKLQLPSHWSIVGSSVIGKFHILVIVRNVGYSDRIRQIS